MNRKIEIPEPPDNLSLTQEAACFIALKAREFDAKVDPVESDPGSNATDSDMADILSNMKGDPTQQELVDAICGLNDDQRIELVALTWLGRGDFTTWDEALQVARDRDPGQTAEYLIGVPLLSDHLEEGLNQIGLNCTEEDIDHSGAPNPREAAQ
jgi:hypothetical protein